jgi:hypothetical protein
LYKEQTGEHGGKFCAVTVEEVIRHVKENHKKRRAESELVDGLDSPYVSSEDRDDVAFQEDNVEPDLELIPLQSSLRQEIEGHRMRLHALDCRVVVSFHHPTIMIQY